MRAKPLISTVIAVMLLGACSSTDPEPSPPGSESGSPSPTATADAMADPSVATASAEPDAGATSDAESDPATASSDPYCDPADAGYVAMGELLEATDRKSTETGVEDDGGDVAAMNAAGEAMLVASAQVRDAWTEARAQLDAADAPTSEGYSAEDADDAFQGVLDHLDAWVDPEAQIAAESASIAEYDAAVVALLTDEATVEAASRGGEGLSVVLGYTIERCGDLPAA